MPRGPIMRLVWWYPQAGGPEALLDDGEGLGQGLLDVVGAAEFLAADLVGQAVAECRVAALRAVYFAELLRSASVDGDLVGVRDRWAKVWVAGPHMSPRSPGAKRGVSVTISERAIVR